MGQPADFKSHIGWEGPEQVDTVDAGQLRRFAEAIADDDPRWLQVAQPTFAVTLLQEPPAFAPALGYGVGWLNAGDHFEYMNAIRLGDQLRVRSRLADAYEKLGSAGPLLFLIFVTEFRNQHDELAIKHTGTRIRR